VKKLKIYLDTCVIGYLDQRDDPLRMAETHKMWKQIKAGKYDVVISNTTERELSQCHPEKFAVLTEYLSEITYETVFVDRTIIEVADKFIELGILTQKSLDDCRHIAAAIVSGCDAIVSWNFKHIANPQTAKGAKAVTTLTGYKDLLIFTPTFLIKGDDDNDS